MTFYLEHYGLRSLDLKWIRSSFSKREQFVQFKETRSPAHQVKCSVAQDSLLGPLLFVLYINDLPYACAQTEGLLFADHNSIYFLRLDINQVQVVMNKKLDSIATWMKTNILSVNIEKTSHIIFRPRQKELSSNISLFR